MTLKSINWSPMSRKDSTNFFGIILSLSVTRNNSSLFRTNHKFSWLQSPTILLYNRQNKFHCSLTIVDSYSRVIAPRAFSSRPFFSISNINVSTGSDNFFVSHQRTQKEALNIYSIIYDQNFSTLPSVEAEKNSVPDFDCNQMVLYAGSR